MPGRDAIAQKAARGYITRRPIDASQLIVTVSPSSINITGVVRPLRGRGNVDLKDEMHKITDILRQRMHVNTVTWDVVIRE